MATTVPPQPTNYRYDRAGKTYILTSIASSSYVPTRVEISATSTLDITKHIVAINGFTTDRETTVAPIAGSNGFPVLVDGAKTTEDCSIEIWADKLGVDVRSVVAIGDTIYPMFCPGGDIPTAYAAVWKCTVRSIGAPTDLSAVARVMLRLNPLDANERVVIPA